MAFSNDEYFKKYGFVIDVQTDKLPRGINKDIICQISKKKNEPSFILDFRLKAYDKWKQMKAPTWGNFSSYDIDFQNIVYFSQPKIKKTDSLEDADPKILEVLDKLGISLEEKKRILNVDFVIDSTSIGVSFKKKLKEKGIILCSINEAIHKYPKIINKYLASVVSYDDNFFACLNSAVFSDGSFIYIPKNVKCPFDLSTYFRMNDAETAQFERTLIIADSNSSVNYLEGCSAPVFSKKQLHAAVVELIALDGATINYSTVQNWYAGNEKDDGGIYNFVTKRGCCLGKGSRIKWAQVEVGSSITWKYPSCILKGDDSSGDFYSISFTNKNMQADTGSKMIHIGKRTKSKIISKGICADQSKNTYRSLVNINKKASCSNNYSRCDAILIGDKSSSFSFPCLNCFNNTSKILHEAFASKIDMEKFFYLRTRGFDKESAMEMVLSGFCMEVINNLPYEFKEEVKKILAIKMENI